MSASAGHRESALPGPRGTAGYHTVLVVGASGSGKTSLVRHLIGTAGREPFPAVSRARTTIAETEIVLAPDPRWYAVATFRSEASVRTAIVENLVRAAESLARGRPLHVVTHDLVDHAEQRIRLHHLLGDPGRTDTPGDPWAPIIERLRRVAERCGTDPAAIEADPAVADLTAELLDDIRGRLRALWGGTYWPEEAPWPTTWSCAVDRREALFARILPLISNDARHFGALLTPLVDGIRLRGPFRPSFSGSDPFLMVVDSEGLGHVTATATALPPELVDQLDRADRVVLVDNASMPIGAASLGALRQIVASGHGRKLVVCFTHLDQVEGPDLPTFDARRMLLLDSLRQAKAQLADEFGPSTARVLEDTIDERTFLLGSLHETGPSRPVAERNTELARLLAAVRADDRPSVRPGVAVTVERDELDAAVLSAVGRFRLLWMRRLGLRPPTDVRPLHWRRLAALARRVADGGEGYDAMLPAEELATVVVDAARRALEAAAEDGGGAEPAVGLGAMLDDVAVEATRRLRTQARNHLLADRRATWAAACDLSGRGSAADRARRVWDDVFDAELALDDPAPLLVECIAAVRAAAAHAGFDVTDEQPGTPAPALEAPTISPTPDGDGFERGADADRPGAVAPDANGRPDGDEDEGHRAGGHDATDPGSGRPDPDRVGRGAERDVAGRGGAAPAVATGGEPAGLEPGGGEREPSAATDGSVAGGGTPEGDAPAGGRASGPPAGSDRATAPPSVRAAGTDGPHSEGSTTTHRPPSSAWGPAGSRRRRRGTLDDTARRLVAAVGAPSSPPAPPVAQPDDADPLRTERWVRSRLRGARLVAEMGIDRELHDLLAEAMRQLLERSSVAKAARTHPNLLAAYLATEGVFHYEDGTLYPNLCVPDARKAGIANGRAFDVAVRELRMETFEDLVWSERALRYVTPILAHGGIPASSLDELFALIADEVGRGATSGEELLRAWRAEPARFARVDKPVERFLLGGGELARDLLDRYLDLASQVARSADGTGDDGAADLADVAGLPRHVCDAYVHGSARIRVGERRMVHAPGAELDPYDGRGPRLVLRPLDTPSDDAAWVVHDGTRLRRFVPSRFQPEVVDLHPARRWDVRLRGGAGRSWSIDGLERPPVLLFDAETGRSLPKTSIAADTVLVLYPRDGDAGGDASFSVAGVEARTGRVVPREQILDEELPDQVGAWAGYRVDRLRLAGLRALVFDGRGVDVPDARLPVRSHRARARLATFTVPHTRTADGLEVCSAWPEVVLPDGWEHRPPVLRLVVDGVEHVLDPVELRTDDGALELARADLPAVAARVRLTVRGTIGADLRAEWAVVEGLDVDQPDAVGLPGRTEPTVRVRAGSSISLGGEPAGGDVALQPAPDEHVVAVTAAGEHGSGPSCALVIAVEKLSWAVHGASGSGSLGREVVTIDQDQLGRGTDRGLIVRLGRAGVPTRLVCRSDDGEVHELPSVATAGAEGSWLFDLGLLVEPLAARPRSGHELVLRVGDEEVPVAHIRPSAGVPDVEATVADGVVRLEIGTSTPRAPGGQFVQLWSRQRPWAAPIVRPLDDAATSGPATTVTVTIDEAEVPPGGYLVEIVPGRPAGPAARPDADRAATVRIGSADEVDRSLDRRADGAAIVELERALALGRCARRLDEDELDAIAPEAVTALAAALSDPDERSSPTPSGLLAALVAGARRATAGALADAVEDGRLDERVALRAAVVLAPHLAYRMHDLPDDDLARLWVASTPLAALLELGRPLAREAIARCERHLGWAPGTTSGPEVGRPVTDAALRRDVAGLAALRRAMDLVPTSWLHVDALASAQLEWLEARARRGDDVERWWDAWKGFDRPTGAAVLRHLVAREPEPGAPAVAALPCVTLAAATAAATGSAGADDAVRALSEAVAWAPRLVAHDLVLAAALTHPERAERAEARTERSAPVTGA